MKTPLVQELHNTEIDKDTHFHDAGNRVRLYG